MNLVTEHSALLSRLSEAFEPSAIAVLCADNAVTHWRQALTGTVGAASCHTDTDSLLAAGPDFVFVSWPDAWVSTATALQQLGFLRDHVKGVVIVNNQPPYSASGVTDPHTDPDTVGQCVRLSRSDFFSLGYTECTASTDLYLYSLKHYKTPPAWLNAKYWAHPERWDLDDDMAIGP